jgi:glutamate racemase
MGSARPVGVFDSGVGGLSVLRAVREELPHEQLLYVGDSGCAPYGDRSPAFVTERATTMTQFLVGQGVAVVVACNTAAVAVAALRGRPLIVAIEPAVKPPPAERNSAASACSQRPTVSSPNIAGLANYGSDVEFVIQPCPGLADQVEKGELSSDQTRALVSLYVRPLVDRGADIIVLGCTHYPFLRPLIEDVAGPAVDIIDPATAVARELRRRLEARGLLRDGAAIGTESFWTTGNVDEVAPIMGQLWGRDIEVRRL